MERRELDEIERFFATLGHRTPLAYYGLPEDADSDTIDAAIKKRRTWAQGQQANPKYRTEALFLIKSNAMLRRLLLEERETYREVFGSEHGGAALVELDTFVRRSLGEGGWNGASEAAIRAEGERLGMDAALVEARLTGIARELNLTRQGDEELGALAGVDVYALLQVSPGADTATLEAAYRNRYRWARTLRDLEKSSKILSMLDAAWRIVRDPQRRALYDSHRDEVQETTEEVSRSSKELDDLLRDTVPAEPARDSRALLDAVRASPRAAAATEPTAPPAPRPAVEPPPLRMQPPGAVPAVRAAPVAPPVRAAAPGPAPGDAPIPNIQGRTIGLAEGPQMVRERAPKLHVPVRSPVRLQLPRGGRRISWPLRVQNAGQGRMPGRVTSDQPWLIPARDWLDPLAKEQEIAVELDAALLDGGSGTGNLTVVTDHGERRTIAFAVTRTSYVAPLLGLLAVVGLGGGGYLGWQTWQASQAPPAPVVARLHLVPPADHVRVDGVEVGSGESVNVAPPVRGTPFRLQVEGAGLAPVDQRLTVSDTSFDLPVTLPADETLSWNPAGLAPAVLPATGAEVLQARADELGACFQDGGSREAGVAFTVRVARDGHPRGLDLVGEGVDLAAARPCVVGIVRELTFTGTEAPRTDGTFLLTLRVGR